MWCDVMCCGVCVCNLESDVSHKSKARNAPVCVTVGMNNKDSQEQTVEGHTYNVLSIITYTDKYRKLLKLENNLT